MGFYSLAQCHWALYMWHVPLIETCLHWHLCHWPLSGSQWRADLQYCVSAFSISYEVILQSVQNLSQEGRQEPLQTCGTHITVVVCFFNPCIFMYGKCAKTFSTDKWVSIFYTVINLMLNPLIYTLKNSEMMNAMRKLWRKKYISYQISASSTMKGVIWHHGPLPWNAKLFLVLMLIILLSNNLW